MSWSEQFADPRGLLGRLAGRWMARANREINAWTLEQLPLRSNTRLLELGCGPGVGIELASIALGEGWIAAVDPSAAMLGQAYRRNEETVRRGRVTLVKARAAELPFAGASFDVAFAVNAGLAWAEPRRGFREIARVLRPGGCFALTQEARNARDRAEQELIRERLERALLANGYTQVRTERARFGRRDAFCLLARRGLDSASELGQS